MKKIVVFGGTGGLGQKLIPFLEEKYEVTSIGSKNVDITSFEEVKNFFLKNEFDIVLNMSGVKHDVFLSKISEDDLSEIDKMIDVNI
jgi:dTDP-4-dehydrorhamnose reductase